MTAQKNAMRRKTLNFRHLPDINETPGRTAPSVHHTESILPLQRGNVKNNCTKTTGFVKISNHTSRLDYIFTGVPLLPVRMNYVAGYNEFHRSHLSFVFRLLRVIPKKNFTADLYTVKEISRVIKSGGRWKAFPAPTETSDL